MQEYVAAKRANGTPAALARALMVAGFSNPNAVSDAFLEEYEDAAGFLGGARKAAHYAYERNVWARHWYGEMCAAKEPEEFWRFSVLFCKVVDGRFYS